MRTLDTNVVVRLLIGDDLIQTPIAERAFLDAIAVVVCRKVETTRSIFISK